MEMDWLVWLASGLDVCVDEGAGWMDKLYNCGRKGGHL